MGTEWDPIGRRGDDTENSRFYKEFRVKFRVEEVPREKDDILTKEGMEGT